MHLAQKLEILLREKVADDSFSGVVALRRQGHPLFSGAYGFADRARQVENQADTRFRLASISKLFTAVAVLQLVDQGLLALDTPVVPILALEESQIPPAVTVEQLLTEIHVLIVGADSSSLT